MSWQAYVNSVSKLDTGKVQVDLTYVDNVSQKLSRTHVVSSLDDLYGAIRSTIAVLSVVPADIPLGLVDVPPPPTVDPPAPPDPEFVIFQQARHRLVQLQALVADDVLASDNEEFLAAKLAAQKAWQAKFITQL